MELKKMITMKMLNENRLIVIETEDGECLFCGPSQNLLLRDVAGKTVIDFYPERCGRFCGGLGITFVVKEG